MNIVLFPSKSKALGLILNFETLYCSLIQYFIIAFYNNFQIDSLLVF